MNDRLSHSIPHGLVTPCSNMGEIILGTIGISKDTSFKWAGPGFCLGFFVLTFGIGLRTLHTFRMQRNIGSSREQAKEENDDEIVQVIDVAAAQQAMDFTAMAIAWKDLCYTVEVAAATPKSEDAKNKQQIVVLYLMKDTCGTNTQKKLRKNGEPQFIYSLQL